MGAEGRDAAEDEARGPRMADILLAMPLQSSQRRERSPSPSAGGPGQGWPPTLLLYGHMELSH
jgi:hypothetical protein